jgi:hypothetical protein
MEEKNKYIKFLQKTHWIPRYAYDKKWPKNGLKVSQII